MVFVYGANHRETEMHWSIWMIALPRVDKVAPVHLHNLHLILGDALVDCSSKGAVNITFPLKRKGSPIWRASKLLILWRRGSGSNRRIKVLQTSPLPLGYRASGGLYVSALQCCRRSVSQAGLSFWSGRPGSNRRHLPWQGSTLPLSYSRSYKSSIAAMFFMVNATRWGSSANVITAPCVHDGGKMHLIC
jgi:hypothetical protein